MKEINQADDVTSRLKALSALRLQNEILPFTETPSDKYKLFKAGFTSDNVNNRIDPFELFSLFTADVIKQKVFFIR